MNSILKTKLMQSSNRKKLALLNDYDYYDYNYETLPIQRNGIVLNPSSFGGHSGFGSHSGYGHGQVHSSYGNYCLGDIVPLPLLLTVGAALPIMFYVLYTKIQANGGRKKRDSSTGLLREIFDLLTFTPHGNLVLSCFCKSVDLISSLIFVKLL